MKNQLSFSLLILLCIVFKPASAQEVKLGGNYSFLVTLPKDHSHVKRKSGSGELNIKKGRKINVVEVGEDTIVFKYWRWGDSSSQLNIDYYGADEEPNLYSLSKKDFINLTRPIYNRFKGFEVGAYSVPYRLRGLFQRSDTFDFESSLSLQANFIFGWGNRFQQQSQYDFSLGLGLTKIELSPLNSGANEDRTASALTLSLGGVWKPTPYANIGIFVGWDWLSAKDKSVSWTYDGRVWMGIGINVSFNALQAKDNTGKPGDNEDN